MARVDQRGALGAVARRTGDLCRALIEREDVVGRQHGDGVGQRRQRDAGLARQSTGLGMARDEHDRAALFRRAPGGGMAGRAAADDDGVGGDTPAGDRGTPGAAGGRRGDAGGLAHQTLPGLEAARAAGQPARMLETSAQPGPGQQPRRGQQVIPGTRPGVLRAHVEAGVAP